MPETQGSIARRAEDNTAQAARSKAAGDAADDAVSRDKLQSAAGMGKLEKKGRTPMPTPEAGEDMLSPTYRERLRKWRDDDTNIADAAASIPRR